MPNKEKDSQDLGEPEHGHSLRGLIYEVDISPEVKDEPKCARPAYLEWQNINYFVPSTER